MEYTQEVWMSIVDAPYYQVSNLGRVKSLERRVSNNVNGGTRIIKEKILSAKKEKHGYMAVNLYNKPQVGKMFRIHRLVASAFIGEIPDGLIINHLDGDKANNKVENLEITTYGNNSLHSHHVLENKNTPVMKGVNHPNCKLTEFTVLRVREMYASGIVPKKLTEYFDIPFSTLCNICYRTSWKHI